MYCTDDISNLQDICLQAVAANFDVSPSLAYLPEAHLSKLISLLSLELPLELAGTVRDTSNYTSSCLQDSTTSQRLRCKSSTL